MIPDIPNGEFGLIAWLRERSKGNAQTVLGIGDDCAVLRANPGRELLVTTDMLMDGRHFRLSECGPEAAGYKALGANLSDIAAMAGVPFAAFVSVALPKARAAEVASALHAGFAPFADRFGVALAGGDTNVWDGPLVVSVTVLGESTGAGPVLRSGAKPGDAVLVSGPLGGSGLGRHLRPEPRIELAQRIRELVPIRAMIDLSDGLASDLGHILNESGGLGATLDAPLIPIHSDAVALANHDGRPPLEHALTDGEDFELCFVVLPEHAERLLEAPVAGLSLHRVGTIDSEPGLRIRSNVGASQPLNLRGFDHFQTTRGHDHAG